MRIFLSILCLFFVACSQGETRDETLPSENTLRIQLYDKDLNLDPSATWIWDTIDVFNIAYSSLFLIDVEGDLKPALAEALPDYFDEGTRLRIRLRKDVTFHDDPSFPNGKGREVRADDVIYSIKRIATPSNESALWSLFSGRIVGFDAFHQSLKEKTGRFDDPIEGLKALSDHEIEIKLVRPYVQLLYILAMPTSGIVPKEAVDHYKEDFAHHTVGTGPFQMKQYSSKRIVFERVKGHWQHPVETKGIMPQTIVYEYFDDPWSAFKEGRLDVHSIDADRIHAYVDEDYAVKEELKKRNYGLFRMVSPFTKFIFFNYKKPVIKNRHLRMAIAHAVDWQRLSPEYDTYSASLVPDQVPGHLNLEYKWDPEKAKQELVLAGYPKGVGLPTLKIHYRKRDGIYQAGMIKDSLEAIGMKVSLHFGENYELIESDIGVQSWILDYPDAENIFSLLKSKNVLPSGNNYGYFKDCDFDQMLEIATRTVDKQERTQLYERMNRFLYENAFVIPFRYMIDFYAIGPQVLHLDSDPLGNFRWPYVQLGKPSPLPEADGDDRPKGEEIPEQSEEECESL